MDLASSFIFLVRVLLSAEEQWPQGMVGRRGIWKQVRTEWRKIFLK